MNQTTTNPFEIDETPRYASLKNMFLDSLRALEQQGIIHSLVIDKDFDAKQDLQELSCFPYQYPEETAFAKALPYCPIYENKNIPLVSCQLTGFENFSIMIGVAMDAGELCNVSTEMGLNVCSRYGKEIYDKQYDCCSNIGRYSKDTPSDYYYINEAFVDFRLILDNVRQLQKGKAE